MGVGVLPARWSDAAVPVPTGPLGLVLLPHPPAASATSRTRATVLRSPPPAMAEPPRTTPARRVTARPRSLDYATPRRQGPPNFDLHLLGSQDLDARHPRLARSNRSRTSGPATTSPTIDGGRTWAHLRHAERTERSGGLAPPIVTRMRPRLRRGIQIPDERVSPGPTPLARAIRVGHTFPHVPTLKWVIGRRRTNWAAG